LLEPVGSFHRGLDLRVQALHRPVGHSGIEEVDYAFPVALDRPRGLDHGLEPTVRRPKEPALQVSDGLEWIPDLPEPGQRQLDLISSGRPQVQALERFQPGFLVLRQVLRILQPEEPALLQDPVFPLLVAPDGLKGLVEQVHDVEPVENDRRFSQVFPDPVQVGIPHVATDDIDLGGIDIPGHQIADEALHDPFFAPLPQENDPGGLEITERGHVDVTLAERELVDSKLMEGAQVDRLSGPFDIVLQDPPQAIGVFGRKLRDRGHRHLPAERQNQELEKERKPAAGPRPWHLDLLDPALPAADPRDPGVKIGLVLEEVQMPPSPVLGVVNLAFPSLVARGTRELGALNEVEPEIEPPFLLGELEIDHPPGLGDTESQGKQAEFIHRDASFQYEICLESYHAQRPPLNRINPHRMEENHIFI